jgi:8-amino-7-oxononanoate synthase
MVDNHSIQEASIPLWKVEIKEELDRLQATSAKRHLGTSEKAQHPWMIMNGKRLLNLASNNYLGLAGEEELKKASIQAVETYGAGATASRLIIGNHPLYEEAELLLARWKRAEAGLIFNSGYTANVGIISSLMGRNDLVISDKLNHASIVDGIILSRAECKRYRHNDVEHLEFILKKAPAEQRKLIITDTVFSMDGDIAPLEKIVALKERYNAILMVDEAHSSGIYGEEGEGLIHHLNLQDRVDIQMGTFSKALGCFGAYVVGNHDLIEYFVNKMRSLIFTTALPPAVLGSIIAAIHLVQGDQWRRKALQNNGIFFREGLSKLGFDICGSETQIVPIVIGPNEKTIAMSQRLKEEGIAAIAVRPPTVPENQSRIRFTVMATHQEEDLRWALGKIQQVGRELGVI